MFLKRLANIVRHRVPYREQVAEIAEQQAAITEVLLAIASSPHDLQPIFETMLANATSFCVATGGSLFLFEKGGLRVVARAGPPNPYLADRNGFMFPVPSGTPHAHLIETKSPLHIKDLAADPRYLKQEPLIVTLVEAMGVRTHLILPMLREDELIGAFAIFRKEVRPFTDKQINLLAAFAAQATIALESTRRERQIRELQMELAHANRIATVGQLSSSIAHEVNQPLASVVVSSRAALNWLSVENPDLDKARQSIAHAVEGASRAADIVGRIRDLIKKAPPRKDLVDINEAIREVIVLTRGEAQKNGVLAQTLFAEGLPLVQGDRVQLQQVMLNLIINAIQAMSEVAGRARNLHVTTSRDAAEGIRVAVLDSGPGLGTSNPERVFESFYSTKPNGMGIGLSICRSIVEAHDGRLWAVSNQPCGAVFQFTLRAYETASAPQPLEAPNTHMASWPKSEI
jgi:signal transduction histidine kinase